MEILWKRSVSTESPTIRPKLCGNCAFSQNFYTRKLGKITVFYAVFVMQQNTAKYWNNVEIGLKGEELENENEGGISVRTFLFVCFPNGGTKSCGDG